MGITGPLSKWRVKWVVGRIGVQYESVFISFGMQQMCETYDIMVVINVCIYRSVKTLTCVGTVPFVVVPLCMLSSFRESVLMRM